MKPPQRFGTPTIECPRGGDVRKYTSAKDHVVKNQKMTVHHFGLRRKYTDTRAQFAHCIEAPS